VSKVIIDQGGGTVFVNPPENGPAQSALNQYNSSGASAARPEKSASSYE